MLYGDGPSPLARIVGVSQHPGVPPDEVAELAAADLARLAAGHRRVVLVQSGCLAAAWPAPGAWPVRVMPTDQPMTGVWWGILDELCADPDGANPQSDDSVVVVAADYDPNLRYLCLTAFEKEPAEWKTQ
jgi:hypothetical protein